MNAFIDIHLEHKEYKYHRHQEYTHRYVLYVLVTQHHAIECRHRLYDEKWVSLRRDELGLILWGCTIWLVA